jgi:hypothetical protein
MVGLNYKGGYHMLVEYCKYLLTLIKNEMMTYKSVTKDLVSWFPKLKLGGVIAGHDYFNKRVEVQKAVDEYLAEHQIALMLHRVDVTARIGIFYPLSSHS